MMVQGRQKSLNSLWGIPEPAREVIAESAPPQPQLTQPKSGKITFAVPKTVLLELESREIHNQSRANTPDQSPSRDRLKLTFKVAPDQLRLLADRKPPPKKVVHPFFQKKQKKASHVVDHVEKAVHVSDHVSNPPAPKSHVIQSIGPVSRPAKKPAVWFGAKKEKKKLTTPFPAHNLFHVIPESHATNQLHQQRLSFHKRYLRSINSTYHPRTEKNGITLPSISKPQTPPLHLPTRHVLSREGILHLARELCGELVSDSAIQSLLSRVTNLSAFDTADRETQLWVDKYRPKSRSDLVGSSSHQHVASIASWLKTRLSRRTCLVKSSHQGTPSSDFIVDDDAVMAYENGSETDPLLLVLSGPTSSGKKASLLAACQQLDLFVFKLNATTGRTQKELMSALQGLGGSQLVNKKHKSCIILIEDVDVLYDDEKGFWSVLEKVLEKSKVAVVVTTSEVTIEREFPPSFEGHVVWELFERQTGKGVVSGKTTESRTDSNGSRDLTEDARDSSEPPRDISEPPRATTTPDILPTYLSLLCLCEGYEVSIKDSTTLLSKYAHDIRQTINHLQFWCQMGVGDPLGGFNWVIPISEGQGKRVLSGDMFVDNKEEVSSITSSSTSSDIQSLFSSYENASIYDLYSNSFHSSLSQTMSSEEHSALAHDTPLGWKCLEEDTEAESDPLEWEVTDMLQHLSLNRDGHVSTLNTYSDRVELKNLLFDDMVYYSQINTVPMSTARAQILPYLRHMAQADRFYQTQFEAQQQQFPCVRKSRRSMASMGISIPVTHLEWDLDGIMATKLNINGLYDPASQ
ncbi:Telomere length regulation protein [Yarrowia sp. C11]|nr:Telomere length regulation protein [Yarrowia sp. E02]KAG5367477.1 Telomere length regulation protein [Yarrowia sp. C11]